MHIRNVNKVIHRNGDTSDIIRVVMMAYDIESDPQIYELAKKLKGSTTVETCQNIWQYLVDTIDYAADSDGNNGEMVRTPARLVHDRTGDCKSYSLFTAVILRYLKIPHVFRFASYSSRKEATHVYVVAFEGDSEIVIDAVAKEQLNTPFGVEKQYTYRCDMANGGTKISYLAGIGPAKNKIGSLDANSDERYRIWIGNETEGSITPGKAWLYGRYDLLNEMIGISKSNSETAKLYNELSLIAAMLWAYNHVNGETAECRKMALIIAGMVHDGTFTHKSTDNDFRSTWFDSIVSLLTDRYNTGLQPTKRNENVYQTIKTNVLDRNQLPEGASIAGIGAYTPLADALKKAGFYFLYLFIPDNEVSNYPAAVAKKRFTQNFFYQLIHKVDIFHNSTTVLEFFRAGIIARTGMQPETYIKTVQKTNVKNIGSITLATVGAIVSIILGLLTIIKILFPNSAAAQYAPQSGAADLQNELYSNKKAGTGFSNTSNLSNFSSYVPILGASLLGLVLIKKNKE